ncbi:MAG TPA: ComEA family DNA-binding protein [Acidimicrobiia bacterium]
MGVSTWKVGMVLAGAAVVVGGWFGSLQRAPATASTSRPQTTSTFVQPGIRVHVGGWVVAPGVVSLPEGSLVADAVAAAGGMRPGALADAINLAAPVSDGAQVIVPGPGAAATAEGAAAGAVGGDGRIAVNRATAAELENLPGVGPVLAERIVAYREQNGPFETVEDLLQVPGIGEAKLAALRDLIAVP